MNIREELGDIPEGIGDALTSQMMANAESGKPYRYALYVSDMILSLGNITGERTLTGNLINHRILDH